MIDDTTTCQPPQANPARKLTADDLFESFEPGDAGDNVGGGARTKERPTEPPPSNSSSNDPLADDKPPYRLGVANRTLRANGVTLDQNMGERFLTIPYFKIRDHYSRRERISDSHGSFFRKRFIDPLPGAPKYWQFPETIPHAYFPKGAYERIQESGQVTVCEGEFKALALVEAGFPAIAIGGIQNFALGEELVPELMQILKDTTLGKLFFLGDADTALNPQFAGAAIKFYSMIHSRSARTAFLLPRMPLLHVQEQKGIDDARAALGAEQFNIYFRDLLQNAIQVDHNTAQEDLAFGLLERERGGLIELVRNATREEQSKILKKLLRLANACGAVRGRDITEMALAAGLVKKGQDFKAEQKHQAQEDARERAAAAPKTKVELFYCPKGSKNYLYQGDPESFTMVDRKCAAKHLIACGRDPQPKGEDRLSEVDQILTNAERAPVDWVGPLAGRKIGLYDIKGRRILVIRSPKLVPPKEGEYDTIRNFLAGLLDYDPAGDPEKKSQEAVVQSNIFLAWLSRAVRDLYLYDGRFTPSQALVLAGPKRVGKNVLQDIITECFGGRSEAPFDFMDGRSSFNGHLVGAPHWMIADEQESKKYSDRQKLKSFIKQFCVNRYQSMNAKFSEAVSLDPFRRLTISLNDDAESLRVLPPLSENFGDKLIILRAFKKRFCGDGTLFGDFQTWWQTVIKELPAFLHHLLDQYQVPDELRDHDYGVVSYHNPDILTALDRGSTESDFAEIIDRYLFSAARPSWRGTARELIEELDRCGCPDIARVESYRKAIHVGQYLSALVYKHPERFRGVGEVRGYATYEIMAPEKIESIPRPS